MIDKDILLAVIFCSVLVLVLIAVLVFVFFVSGRRQMKQQIELSVTKLNFERELRQVESEVSEQILEHFSSELHDNIGQLLTATHIQIENQKLDHPEHSDIFKQVENYLGEVTQQLRFLSRTMNHDYLGNIGLSEAIKLETDRLKKLKRFEVHLDIGFEASGLEKNQELMLFRIFQEIAQNALRHSGAKNFFIKIDVQHEFELHIKDDGRGFDKKEVFQSGKASGLRNIIKRARLADMDLQIDSVIGEGSLFILKKVSNLS